MSTPWIPLYFGSWREFINSLLHNPFLGAAAPAPPPSDPRPTPHPEPHPEARRGAEPVPSPWSVSEPVPSPWRIAVATIVALVGTRQVAHGLPEGRLKENMTADLDQAVSDIIDDWCGTKPRPWPPHTGPQAEIATLVAALGVAAQAFGASGMREDLLRVAGQLVQKASAATAKRELKMPTPEEFDAMEKKEFGTPNSQCDTLCADLLRDL